MKITYEIYDCGPGERPTNIQTRYGNGLTDRAARLRAEADAEAACKPGIEAFVTRTDPKTKVKTIINVFLWSPRLGEPVNVIWT